MLDTAEGGAPPLNELRGLRAVNFSETSQPVARCPKCGNTKQFVLIFGYLRLDIYLEGGKVKAVWDEAEPEMAYCAVCSEALELGATMRLYELVPGTASA